MTPDERFKLNHTAKEHRLQKVKKRLEGSTPKSNGINRAKHWNLARLIFWGAIPALVWFATVRFQ